MIQISIETMYEYGCAKSTQIQFAFTKGGWVFKGNL